ncbi:MAG TPA: glucan biosynthesis protein [Amaricoccus sp.]|nr:glucan biosynthesis protein [Amaricoccus sp.]
MMRRRHFLGTAAALALASRHWRARAEDAQGTFSRSVVLEQARALAAQPFVAPPPLPEALQNLSAQDFGAIRFREDRRLFVDPPNGFAVDLIHAGFIYGIPVQISVVEGGVARRIAFDPALYDYGSVPPPEAGAALDFAGFRGLTSLTAPDTLSLFTVFAGASYFQAVARGQRFGMSARGLAINTGEPEGEEFPFFRAHWIEAPTGDRMVVHSLLDGPSATGAYRFTIRPGDQTTMDVEATIFVRAEIAHLGLAPLTSMFLFDAKDRAQHDDFRLGVHDSDGLAMWNGSGERLWRPLHSPRLLQISAFSDSGPRGFGLVQRERRFSEYEDLTARFDRRPSVWVEPIGDWGRGHVVLVEIPSGEEVHDNIVAYWRPAGPAAAGSEISLTYRLAWAVDAPDPGGLLRVARTLSGAGSDGRRHFVVDFAGDGQPVARPSAIQLSAQANPGALQNAQISENPEVGGLRLSFELDPEGNDQVELRIDLRSGERPVAETWVYRWSQ